MPSPPPAAPRRAALPATLAWRLLAMVYDAIPSIPVTFLVSTVALVANGLQPVTSIPGRVLLGFALWAALGLYFVVSWRRGGQTLGMRPFRLKVLRTDGDLAGSGALWTRYAVATVSLFAGGLGFLWSLVDAERRTWHDLASGTVLVRLEPERAVAKT